MEMECEPVKDSGPCERDNSVSEIEKQYVNISEISPLPKKAAGSKRRNRTTTSEILTASPYKNKLLESKQKKAPRSKKGKANSMKGKKATRASKDKKMKTKTTRERTSLLSHDDIDWYCFFCGENHAEEMIQCQNCERWIHEACADIDEGSHYKCDDCRNA